MEREREREGVRERDGELLGVTNSQQTFDHDVRKIALLRVRSLEGCGRRGLEEQSCISENHL